jgi:hypothetical protein
MLVTDAVTFSIVKRCWELPVLHVRNSTSFSLKGTSSSRHVVPPVMAMRWSGV